MTRQLIIRLDASHSLVRQIVYRTYRGNYEVALFQFGLFQLICHGYIAIAMAYIQVYLARVYLAVPESMDDDVSTSVRTYVHTYVSEGIQEF